MGWLVCYWLNGTDGLDRKLVGQRWDGGTGVSRRQNESATIGAGMGAPPLTLEGRRAVGRSGWNQLHRCCKGAEYWGRSSKIIQIDFTQIGTNT